MDTNLVIAVAAVKVVGVASGNGIGFEEGVVTQGKESFSPGKDRIVLGNRFFKML
ncbi:hypothetical protein [Marispirochaeta sp.]|uniref:hypothetical protein n=1 Tax=Marispirochaeta sp. TaxID=2038653 RepID=UPI0029C72F6B|nr:hypothetical protein [Marispirochaeta sp.]